MQEALQTLTYVFHSCMWFIWEINKYYYKHFFEELVKLVLFRQHCNHTTNYFQWSQSSLRKQKIINKLISPRKLLILQERANINWLGLYISLIFLFNESISIKICWGISTAGLAKAVLRIFNQKKTCLSILLLHNARLFQKQYWNYYLFYVPTPKL